VLFAAAPATVLCPYDTRAVPKRILGHVRHAHPELVTGADATANPDYQRPERLVLAG
jgi:hypothetical protein